MQAFGRTAEYAETLKGAHIQIADGDPDANKTA
jgi:hypothetical protein